ncbi:MULTISPECIES: carbohydrate kinase [unclassified Paracoccus (in: a-proteobacteria)]|uniref:carbohydrate kinase family protein n=1 Tax=unclassified Paracoccus (in: a-proteobacteria) TaxID=2688777 RepID=UPI0016021E1F|nr:MULTISPECIES: carbohydrate kinase [unclassified Paracoccus (in: a-proteobacteria)]MBB1491235.1 carbohydrate kinase [Paracoccus sp. MC1854]MBB1498015.1 carbohydrate kinase [Paracoccus sp. MC1862]QQO43540.1 carbohydrate kinase [Paracoccus sp. MC1862]
MILCTGEALIDMVPQPDRAFRPLPGGSVYNTALALGRLGASAGFLWPISRDGFANLLLRPLAEAGVDTSACPRSDRPTTLALVSLARGEARYTFHDEGSAGRMFSAGDLPSLPPDLQALFIGGISLAAEPCGATVETFAERAAASGVPVMLDPNLRPFFITDEPALRARLDRLFGLAAIIKLSADDCGCLWPGTNHEAIARDLLARGTRLVLMTRGAQGAAAITPRHRVEVPAIPVTVADTIGAGDTFNAGILDALSRAGALHRLDDLDAPTLTAALSHAARAAAVTVSRPGANPPWRHELA